MTRLMGVILGVWVLTLWKHLPGIRESWSFLRHFVSDRPLFFGHIGDTHITNTVTGKSESNSGLWLIITGDIRPAWRRMQLRQEHGNWGGGSLCPSSPSRISCPSVVHLAHGRLALEVVINSWQCSSSWNRGTYSLFSWCLVSKPTVWHQLAITGIFNNTYLRVKIKMLPRRFL